MFFGALIYLCEPKMCSEERLVLFSRLGGAAKKGGFGSDRWDCDRTCLGFLLAFLDLLFYIVKLKETILILLPGNSINLK
jgi:hypothetical protein